MQQQHVDRRRCSSLKHEVAVGADVVAAVRAVAAVVVVGAQVSFAAGACC